MMCGENELRETYVPIITYKMDTNFIVVAGETEKGLWTYWIGTNDTLGQRSI